MSFWNEAFFFEKAGDRYIYRPTVFSPGFEISKSEKDHLFRDLKRLEWRILGEGSILLALVAGLFMTGTIEGQKPVLWSVLVSAVALALLALISLYRRERLVRHVLGRRPPDVPRLPFRQALARPRPLVTKRFAIPVLKSVFVLLALAVAGADGLVLYIVIAAYRSRQLAEGPDEIAAAEELLSLTMGNAAFLVIVVLFNAVLLASMVFCIRQVRRLRAAPDF